MSTKFFTNKTENTIFDKFKGIFENMANIYSFHAVVGYFRSSGYFALQKYLKDIQDVKILVGINVDQMFAEAQKKGLLYFGDEEKTKKEFEKDFLGSSAENVTTTDKADAISAQAKNFLKITKELQVIVIPKKQHLH